jgi:hypothetical protein
MLVVLLNQKRLRKNVPPRTFGYDIAPPTEQAASAPRADRLWSAPQRNT